jgi:hypothetical protein
MCSLFTVWASARLFPHFFLFLICVPSTFFPCTFIPCTLFPANSLLALLFPSYLFPAYLFMSQSPHIRSLYICSLIFVPVKFSFCNSSLTHLFPAHSVSAFFSRICVPCTFFPAHLFPVHLFPEYLFLVIRSPYRFFAIYLPQFLSCTLFPERFLGDFSSPKCTELKLIKINNLVRLLLKSSLVSVSVQEETFIMIRMY